MSDCDRALNMSDEPDERCGTCRFWRYGLVSPHRTGTRCQRRSPTAATREGSALFPEMPDSELCGDWTAIPRKAD